ncbi:hypothetical protein K438DRAFT_1936661 [Mycena galopus ATCC 62051]|nr:hypothetical protein K438DRAFT_1936661 [Mycena galopus ATCC 62051]
MGDSVIFISVNPKQWSLKQILTTAVKLLRRVGGHDAALALQLTPPVYAFVKSLHHEQLSIKSSNLNDTCQDFGPIVAPKRAAPSQVQSEQMVCVRKESQMIIETLYRPSTRLTPAKTSDACVVNCLMMDAVEFLTDAARSRSNVSHCELRPSQTW